MVGRATSRMKASVRGSADGCDVVLHVAGIATSDHQRRRFRRSTSTERDTSFSRRSAPASRKSCTCRRSARIAASPSTTARSSSAKTSCAAFSRDWVVLRPGAVYGPGDEHVSVLLQMIRSLPVIPTIGDGNQPFQPMWHEDLGEALGHLGRARRRPMLHARDCGPGPYVTERSHRPASTRSRGDPRRRLRCPSSSRHGVCAHSTRSASAFHSPKRSFGC